MVDVNQFYLDEPVSSSGDLLGYSEIAKSLLKAIEAQPNQSSLTLGLDGVWGSGKSSIFSMLEHDVSVNPSHDEIGTVIVSFSPWLITNRTALIASFFTQLQLAVKRAENRLPTSWFKLKKATAKNLATVRKKLNRFSRVVSITSGAAIAFDPTGAAALASGSAKAVEQVTETAKDSNDTLETLKADLERALADIAAADPTFRIVVLIDDLDRLDPNDTLEILRLVKAVGDFPAVTYMLAYDRGAVASAIQHSARVDDGDAYLEKIIQFSFKVPPLEPFQLRNWLRREIAILAPGENLNSDHASAVLDVWAGRLLKTPRDIKRLLFAIRAIWPRLNGRADLLDLVWLQMLSLKASFGERDLYSWVASYFRSLQAIAIGGSVSGKAQEQKDLEEILKALGWRTYTQSDKITELDFHNLNTLLAGVSNSYLSQTKDETWTYQLKESDLQQWRQDKRLSSPWHWRLYFAFETPEYAITDDEWSAMVSAAAKSSDDLVTSIEAVVSFRGKQRPNAAGQLLEWIIHEKKTNRLAHPQRWLKAIVREAPFLKTISPKDRLFGFTNLFDSYLRDIAVLVFKDLTKDQRNSLIDLVFDHSENLEVGAAMLQKQMHSATKSSYDQERELFLTAKELENAKARQLALFRAMSVDYFWQLTEPYTVLFAWRNLVEGSDQSDEPRSLIEEAIETDEGLVRTLCALRIISSSAQEGVARLPHSFIQNFADVSALTKRLELVGKQGGQVGETAKRLSELWWDDKERGG